MRTRRANPREQFVALLAQFNAANADIYNMSKPDFKERREILDDYRKALFDKAREIHPQVRSKWYACSASDNVGKQDDPAVKIIGLEEWQKVIAIFEPRVSAVVKAVYARRDSLKKQVSDLADTLTPEPGDNWYVYSDTNAYAYSTQTDSRGYAEGRANVTAITIALFAPNIPVFVRYVEKDENDRYSSARWEVRVRLKSKLDFNILKYGGPSYKLADWCLICWVMGINPRAVNNFIPHGIEGDYGWNSPGMVAMRARVGEVAPKIAAWKQLGWNEPLAND